MEISTPEPRKVTGVDGKTYTAAPRTAPVEEPQGEVDDDEDVVEAEEHLSAKSPGPRARHTDD